MHAFDTSISTVGYILCMISVFLSPGKSAELQCLIRPSVLMLSLSFTVTPILVGSQRILWEVQYDTKHVTPFGARARTLRRATVSNAPDGSLAASSARQASEPSSSRVT